VRQQRRLEGEVAGYATDHEGVQRFAHGRDRLGAVAAAGDQLADHRVVVDRDLAAFVDAGVDAHAGRSLRPWLAREQGRRRRPERHQSAGARQEAAQRIFGIDAALDGPAAARDVGLREGQRLAGSDADHLLDQVEPGDALGHRMLDLQTSVHLEKVEAAVAADDEFDRSRGLVIDRAGERDSLLAHGLARRLVEKRTRRFLDHLLVASLDRAFALAEVDAVAVGVAENLDLDMTRAFDEPLDEDAVVAEAAAGLVAARGEARERLGVVLGHAQALAAAPCRGLDHDRIADPSRHFHRLLGAGDGRVVTGNGVDARLGGELLRFDLVAHRGDRIRLRADKDDAFGFDPARELRVLGQEAVSRMHGFGAGLLAGRDDPLAEQVRLPARRRADQHRLVGKLDMERVAIGFREHGDGGDAHAACRLDHAAGDLAAVGDEDLLKHAAAPRSERHVAVLAPWILDLLVPEHHQGTTDPAAGFVRLDDVVDVAACPGDEGVGELCLVLRLARSQLDRVALLLAKMISTAPFGPITAISALGQAKLTSPRRCFELMTS
jgi:hypothetical protein